MAESGRERRESRVITSEHLERAERLLSGTYRIAQGAANPVDAVCHRARIDLVAAERYMTHHKAILFHNHLPDVDPRHEPAIMTMLLHMLAVGAISQRVSEGRS